MKFTDEQQIFILMQLDYWYFTWKNKINDEFMKLRLSIAKEELKKMLFCVENDICQDSGIVFNKGSFVENLS